MKKNKKILGFILGGTFGLLFSIIFSILFKWVQTGNPFKASTIMYGVIFFLNFVILGSIGYKMFKVSLSKSSAQLKKKIMHVFILFVLMALLISLLIVSLGNYAFYLAGGFETDNFIKHLFQVELPSAIRQFFIWILIASVFLLYVIWHQAIKREQQLQEETLKYQYRTLKTQVNPHFLFNSLNTLSEIVYTDAKKADNFIQKLSGVYRYILDNEETDFVSLNKEIEFVHQYIELQKERDNNKIQFNIDIKNADRFKVIPVSLQILVENALKHNSISKENPLKIWIYDESGYLVVSNNIQRKNILDDSSGIGLPNLRERTKLITGREVIVSQENNQFIVKLPVVNI